MSDEPQPKQPAPGRSARSQDTTAPSGGKPKRPERTGWRRIVPTWRLTLGTVLIAAVLLVGGFFLGYSLVKIPSANALATQQSNVYLYADGTVLARDGEVNRENVGLDAISKDAQHAVLAAEDRDFYTESAIDPQAMIRAGWNTVTGKGKQSGSTITQQYVKNYYLAQEQTVTRKAKEFFISIKLDREKSKNDILEGYLNTSFFGRGAYGIQAAAQAYYGTDATDLTAAQGAYLASLLNAPSQYDVVAHPENKGAATARWNYVLDGMVDQGWLDAAERAELTFPMPKETTTSTGMSGQRGYVVGIVKDYLVEHGIVGEEDLDRGGYRITTTLEKDKQDAFVEAVDDKLMSQLDKENREVDTYVRAGGASVDPKTGKVVAMYNGIDYVKQYTPNATRRDFQVGSTFKPFVLASAVQNSSVTQDGRRITPNTVYDGTNKRAVQGWDGGHYAPENEDQTSYGQITVREATDKSVNAVYAQMAVDVGSDKVKETAVDLGLPQATPDLVESPSIALGVAQASVLDMAEAYATLANHGKHGTYTLVVKVVKDGDQELKLPERKERQVISREAADTTTSVLRSVVQKGTATAAQAAGRPAAGKTGTAEEDTAAWFAGYTPELATVVAVMGQDPETAAHKPLYGATGLARINGGGAPAEIWGQYTRQALEGEPVGSFDLRLQRGASESEAPSTGPSASSTGTGGPDGDDEASPDASRSSGRTPGATQQVTPPGTGDTGTTPGDDSTGGETAGTGTDPGGDDGTGGDTGTGDDAPPGSGEGTDDGTGGDDDSDWPFPDSSDTTGQ
ncbi:penicillin-binding protein [Streptomyces sp. ISL-12]|uniref:transglycosylase domain-containing protein n=1 Tax=Streptomyces sp. ISL-12 TaxID=2819177 RepID=UPI001BEA4C49|nr:transglycosylase domain-containing protein [Streptomyces sp. ISL-12]MBT2410753.1 penicillin-binding protein [Streptomyces sp. ISL-12]